MHRISNDASHLQRGPNWQSKPTYKGPAPTYTGEDPHVSHPAKGGSERRPSGVGRTTGSAEPGLAPVQVRLGRWFSLIPPKMVINVSMWRDGGNRPLQAIKGPPLTPLKAFTIPFTFTCWRSSGRNSTCIFRVGSVRGGGSEKSQTCQPLFDLYLDRYNSLE